MSNYASILGHQKLVKMNSIIVPGSFTCYSKPGNNNPPLQLQPPLPNPQAYGLRLAQNKAILVQAMQRKRISLERQALMMGMAMQETNTLSPLERDWTKDMGVAGSNYVKGAENYTIFNMNADFINQARPGTNLNILNDKTTLNDLGGLDVAVEVLDKAFSWEDTGSVCGLGPYVDALNFHRGGRTGLSNPMAYGCPKYRGAMQEMLRQIDTKPDLMKNEERVWIDIQYV